jgi:hypothetical protein
VDDDGGGGRDVDDLRSMAGVREQLVGNATGAGAAVEEGEIGVEAHVV